MTAPDPDTLKQVLQGHSDILILPHNDPDPDAIAAAVGLSFLVAGRLGIKSRIVYNGIIGRAENKALVRYLQDPLHHLRGSEFKGNIPIALVDTQPGAGNNPLPPNIQAAIVIDHHTWRQDSAAAAYVDVRPEVGASATIITEYLQTAKLEPPPHLATALFYGIKTDTMGLGRGASPKDAESYFYLQSKIDVDALTQIERAQVPPAYFKSFAVAIQAARIYDRDLVISFVGPMNYPDLGAEIADLFLRLQDIRWVVCLGVYNNSLVLSIRSRNRQGGAGKLAHNLVGDWGTAGGHGTMAGGQIPLNNQEPQELVDHIIHNALHFLKGDHTLVGKPLI